MDNNELNVKEFLASHILNAAWLFIIYRVIIFRNTDGYSFGTSKWILVACIATSSLIGIIFEIRKYRDSAGSSPALPTMLV